MWISFISCHIYILFRLPTNHLRWCWIFFVVEMLWIQGIYINILVKFNIHKKTHFQKGGFFGFVRACPCLSWAYERLETRAWVWMENIPQSAVAADRTPAPRLVELEELRSVRIHVMPSLQTSTVNCFTSIYADVADISNPPEPPGRQCHL